jgi:Na+-transporting methylmalonyl-CoA/oxaloacetate decarboxylase gamma subunit
MSEFQQGLLITGIGMGLVFVVIIFLWGMMALLMRVMSSKTILKDAQPADSAPHTLLVPEMAVAEGQRRAAAAAVAVGLASSARSSRRKEIDHGVGVEGLNAWQSVHRARQLENIKSRG